MACTHWPQTLWILLHDSNEIAVASERVKSKREDTMTKQHSEGLSHIWEFLEGFCQLCPRPQLHVSVLTATEVHYITMAFPSAWREGSCCVFNQLARCRAVVTSFAYACNVWRHASRRQQSTCIRVHVTCTMALRGVLVCTTRAVKINGTRDTREIP